MATSASEKLQWPLCSTPDFRNIVVSYWLFLSFMSVADILIWGKYLKRVEFFKDYEKLKVPKAFDLGKADHHTA